MSARSAATFTAIIAVVRGGAGVVLDYPREPRDLADWIDGIYAEDAGFTNIPEEEGIYRCTVEERWHGSSDDGEPDFAISATERLLEFGNCTAVYAELTS